MDKQMVGTEEPVLLVSGDGSHTRHIGAGHHRMRGKWQALLPGPSIFLLPDCRLRVFGAAAGNTKVEQIPWTSKLSAFERENVLQV